MKHNKILALKYRPQNFEDLIGQDVMSKTITNAIKISKTPNAYLLTGIRGVGKTTTARLIAKSLNCEKNLNNEIKINCSTENPCSTCSDIINSKHIDVLEMDAASKTGIDDIRELIENSKYSPTSAKFKIFIIDEVHMLSKQAFNGLLKTLEEPPESLKFILATTEVKKIPVTIVSRCQRFDLKRVSISELHKHIKNISAKENGKITDEAIHIIAQASEGSVRDALSLLDRALIHQHINSNNLINDKDIRIMLGLADKSKIIKLIQNAFEGKAIEADKILKELIVNGIEPKSFLLDVLEILSLINRKISLGSIENDKMIPEAELNLINKMSVGLNISDVGLFWQLTLKTIEDLKTLGDEIITLEMYISQLIYINNFNSEDEKSPQLETGAKKFSKQNLSNKIDEQNDEETSFKIKSQLKNTDQLKAKILTNPELEQKKTSKHRVESFDDVVKLANKDNDIELKYDLERNVNLVSFSYGKIDITFNEKLNKNFIKLLTEKLILWTGDRWIISLSQNVGNKTLYEKKNEEKSNQLNKAKNEKEIKKFLETFTDANLVEIRDED